MVSICKKVSERANRRSNRLAKEPLITKRSVGGALCKTNVSSTENANCSLLDMFCTSEKIFHINENVNSTGVNSFVNSTRNSKRRFGIDVTNLTGVSTTTHEIIKSSSIALNSFDILNVSESDKLKIITSTPVVVLERIRTDSASNKAIKDRLQKKHSKSSVRKGKQDIKRKDKGSTEAKAHSKIKNAESFNLKCGQSKTKDTLGCDHIHNVKESSEDPNQSFKLFELDDNKAEQVVTRPVRKRNKAKELDDSSEFQRLEVESSSRMAFKKAKAAKVSHDDDDDRVKAEMLKMKEMDDIFNNYSLLIESSSPPPPPSFIF